MENSLNHFHKLSLYLNSQASTFANVESMAEETQTTTKLGNEGNEGNDRNEEYEENEESEDNEENKKNEE